MCIFFFIWKSDYFNFHCPRVVIYFYTVTEKAVQIKINKPRKDTITKSK